MRTRLHGRPPAFSHKSRADASLPRPLKTPTAPPEKPLRRISLLSCLVFAAVVTASAGLAPKLPGLQQGVCLSARLMLALPAAAEQPSAEQEPSGQASAKPPESIESSVPDEISVPAEPAEPEEQPSAPESDSSQPAPEAALPDPEIPEENKAMLVHKTYTAAPSNIYIPLEAGFIKNCTDHTAEEILVQAQTPPAFSIASGDEPQVLIMHTHTTESYLPFTGDYYDTSLPTRTTDNSRNMAAVGEVITQKLTEAGIGVLHDTTQHDYPSYNGSYDRSAVTVERYLEQYPSIKVVLDIHRDAIISGDTVTAPVAVSGDQTAAQVMIISGCDNGSMNYPNYMQNLSFASALQVQMETDHPGFTRPLLFDYRKYNQHLTTGSILIEVGSHGNTLEQALLSGEWIGESLGKLLSGMRS
ncbi:MAG: stage II sporulation protein P [Oscillospiraceae bacterium]|nr:stage II sporulation protein P [Oscillospiraceae bacterium]